MSIKMPTYAVTKENNQRTGNIFSRQKQNLHRVKIPKNSSLFHDLTQLRFSSQLSWAWAHAQDLSITLDHPRKPKTAEAGTASTESQCGDWLWQTWPHVISVKSLSHSYPHLSHQYYRAAFMPTGILGGLTGLLHWETLTPSHWWAVIRMNFTIVSSHQKMQSGSYDLCWDLPRCSVHHHRELGSTGRRDASRNPPL